MRKIHGFTLIELIIFIVVSAVLATTILIAFSSASSGTPTVQQQITANQLAQQCMEWYIGQRRLISFSSIATGTTVPSYCSSGLPSGYSLSVNVSSTTINSDSNYKTIVVTVSGNGNATLTTLVADY